MREERVGQVRVVEEEARVGLVRIHVEVVDPLGVELARAADEAVDLVALLEEELGEVRAVLAGDAGDQRLPDAGTLGAHAAAGTAASAAGSRPAIRSTRCAARARHWRAPTCVPPRRPARRPRVRRPGQASSRNCARASSRRIRLAGGDHEPCP